jgi:asparagine synthase (glutamine-hydrolysing)
MCGIAGVMRLGSGRAACESVVRKMCDTMVHRGPDDSGTYRSPDGAVALGHRRLAIVDLSPAGRCPMSNEDGSLWITYNGEVYNHAGYRPGLEARGHRYRSHTDTETLLHLYEEQGVRMLDRLRGMFAFALWDAARAELLLARDRLGIKPLYYTIAGGQLIWASEIKAILTHPDVVPELDEAALAQYLSYAAVPPPATLFAGIQKLAPGHYLRANSDGSIQLERWWSPLLPTERFGADARTEGGATELLASLLDEAVVEQTMADVPHGLLLSGGLDSTLILALLSRHLARPVRTFSIGFDDAPGFDEREFSRAAAQEFSSEHTELVLQPREVITALPELVHAQDEPLSDWVCLPLKALTRAVRDAGVIVVQVGEGSDELFSGYPRYVRYARVHARWWRAYAALPAALRRAGAALSRVALGRADGLREVLDLFHRAARDEPIFVSGAIVNWDSEKLRLLSPGFRERLGENAGSASLARQSFQEYGRIAGAPDILSAMAYQDLAIRLPELLLMRVDKMTMLNSVEARVPYLDHRIVELAFQLPPALKTGGGISKRILKRVASGIVPSKFITRRKIGFDVPLSRWLREEPLKSWGERLILDSRLHRRGLFDLARIRELLRRHQSSSIDAAFRLWNLINLCAWYDRWIDPA